MAFLQLNGAFFDVQVEQMWQQWKNCACMCLLARVCLHNYLCLTENASYPPHGFIDNEDNNGAIKAGDWRKIVGNDEGAFRSFQGQKERHSCQGSALR